jgi:predicted PhzF superfamily epimerase YddE/YHI9
MKMPLFQVDSFTENPFQGNPAAVCLLPKPLPDEVLQKIAAEMNLSETAFLVPEGDKWRLRWFTPLVEVDLCGHATLASAQVLYERGLLDKGREALFLTRSGPLRAFWRKGWIELDFPRRDVIEKKIPARIVKAVGVSPLATGISGDNYLIEVTSQEEVARARPDFVSLARLTDHGLILTSHYAAPEYDFVSRFFAPTIGVNEDPVTGSAHCSLAPYWARRLGKTEMTAYQASARGGVLRLQLGSERVAISGQAVLVMAGELQF